MKSTFEKMGGTYTLGADGIYYPNLVSTDEEPHYGKYGIMRKTVFEGTPECQVSVSGTDREIDGVSESSR